MDNFIIQNEAVRVKIGINFDSLIPTPAPRPHIPNKSTPPLTHGKLLIPSSGRDCHFLTFSIISRANNNRNKSSKKRFLSENIPYLKTIWYIVRDKEHLRGYWSLKFESPVPFQGESNQYYGNYEHRTNPNDKNSLSNLCLFFSIFSSPACRSQSIGCTFASVRTGGGCQTSLTDRDVISLSARRT